MKYKYIILIALSLILFPDMKAQFRETPSPALYVVTQFTDIGLGLRGDYHINHWAGFYGSASYGQWHLYKWSGLDKHVKLTAGTLIPFKNSNGNQHDFSVGLNYHWVSGEVEPSEAFKDSDIFHKPFSFELGLTIKYSKFAIAFRTDILRWEPCIDIGIPLNIIFKGHKKCPTYN